MPRLSPIFALWACFVLRGSFYAAMLPLWEGVDEWAHFGVIRAVAYGGKLLPPRDVLLSRDIDQSLRLVPLAWELRRFPPPYQTHDTYWQLPEAERQARQDAFHAMPGDWQRTTAGSSLGAYEVQQAPLYYWVMAPVVWALRGTSLATQALAIRWLGVLLASLAILLIYTAAREVFGDDQVALGCAAIVALMPSLAFVMARVGNDCLAMVLFSLLMIKAGQRPLVMGITLGLGLLTKAYFLSAVPAVAGLLLYRRAKRPAIIVFSTAAAIAGWWYIRNLVSFGAPAGMDDTQVIPRLGFGGALRRAVSIPWGRAIDATLFSHLYCGGWSWLTVRSWMYHALYVVAALAAIGLLRVVKRPGLGWLLALYLWFWVGIFWDVVLIFLTKDVAASMGWYLFAVVGAEVVLAVAGLSVFLGRWTAPAGVTLFAALDLWGMHRLAIPYYAGLIRHTAGGGLESLRWNMLNVSVVFGRLTAFKLSPGLLLALWLAYLAATIGLVAIGVRTARR